MTTEPGAVQNHQATEGVLNRPGLCAAPHRPGRFIQQVPGRLHPAPGQREEVPYCPNHGTSSTDERLSAADTLAKPFLNDRG